MTDRITEAIDDLIKARIKYALSPEGAKADEIDAAKRKLEEALATAGIIRQGKVGS